MPEWKNRRRKRDEEVEELVDLHVERVDAVTEPATGLPFLLVKAEDPDEEVIPLADLLRKAKEDAYGYPEAEEKAVRGRAHSRDGETESYGYPEPEEKAARGRVEEEEKGRLEYPAPRGKPAKKQEDQGEIETGTPGSNTPGSQEWEQQDASLLHQAVQGIIALKGLLKRVLQREEIEQASGHDETASVRLLLEALEDLTEALGAVAGAAALEEAEAGVFKAGRVMSRKNMERVHAAMNHLARAAGFTSIEDFAKAAKEMGLADGEDEAEKAKMPEKDDEAEKAKSSGKGKTEAKKSLDASDGHPEASAVIKALEATGIVGLVRKAAESIAKLEERVKRIEEQPMPGGPLLRGRATMSDYYLVRKGDDQVTGVEGADLDRVLGQISDPYLRDALSREIARALHPATRKE